MNNSVNKIDWLSFFRVGIASVCLFNFASLQLDFASLYGSNGYAPPDISYLLSTGPIPSFYEMNHFLNSYWVIEYDTLLTIFRIIYPLALISLLIGFYSRLAAIVSLLCFVIFTNSYNHLSYGFDVFANFSLFYCVIFPVGQQNAIIGNNKIFDNRKSKKYLRLLQTHICIAYFFSGFEKSLGFNWRNGESLWKALHSISYSENVNINFLANSPFFIVMGWVTILLEMCYPLFINLQRTRKIWLVGMIGLHLSIGILMGLHFFSAIMIILNLTCYYIPYVKVNHLSYKSGVLNFFRTLNTFQN